ncbi:hypothetical protein KAFR_0B04770 [Kazachstania africana CBS 2517]|uniref:Mannosyltransferase n=1 Tax=Kazachstania africana (strain ATCC 22294 / BCRC 22015 / CBS 2517 / CECT 1963 / NBRC 1671 / NRRL Y-8276) TaxID=1071382 RepID=H2AQX4_KAZAF|nr:hypothetical protein KAFR_0B04770 [Kazachstania africana CBS 2517]CCF56774.1 hypothetical protein KAFR_0B04770 [Kazachstania africana CBS 2517]
MIAWWEKYIFSSDNALFRLFVVVRLANALFIRTFFQADEYWQALEPAHYVAFGYGELTWEWRTGLRSYLFPFIFEMGYRFVKVISMLCRYSLDSLVDSPNFTTRIEYVGVIYVPRVIMAVVAAIGDYYTVKLAHKVFSSTVVVPKNGKINMPKQLLSAKIVTAFIVTINFFNWYFSTRSFINSFEMTLTTVALYFWDWDSGDAVKSKHFTFSLIFGILACFLRPSNGLIWAILGWFLLINLFLRRSFTLIFLVLFKVLFSFAVVFLMNTIIDYYFYGYLTFPLFKFIKFNFTTPLSQFYGVAPWHFHIFQSLPFLLGGYLAFFICGLCMIPFPNVANSKFLTPLHQFRLVTVINIIVYSSLAHKEFRFVYPLRPFFTIIAAYGILIVQARPPFGIKFKHVINTVSTVILLLSLFAGMYLTYINESGVIDVMKFLHYEPNINSLGMLMPCHSTPWQSYLHRNDIDSLWAISCEPPLHLLNDPHAAEKLPLYMDESDYLYADTPRFIGQHFPPISDKTASTVSYDHSWPEYLVLFEHLNNLYMKDYLEHTNYVEYKRFFNSYSHWDSRRSGDIIVYRQN